MSKLQHSQDSDCQGRGTQRSQTGRSLGMTERTAGKKGTRRKLKESDMKKIKYGTASELEGGRQWFLPPFRGGDIGTEEEPPGMETRE